MEQIKNVINAAVNELFDITTEITLTRPDEQFGDYATNVALHLSKQIGKNPREIAEAIAERVRGSVPHIREINVAGPGFLNLTLTDEVLAGLAQNSPVKNLTGKTVVAEYSDPNPFKV